MTTIPKRYAEEGAHTLVDHKSNEMVIESSEKGLHLGDDSDISHSQ